MPRQLGKHTADHFVADGISVALIFLIIITTSLSGAISDHYDISFLGAYLLLALINYSVGGNDVFYPAFLYSVLWLTTLTLLASFPIDVDALSERTEFLLFGYSRFYLYLFWTLPELQVASGQTSCLERDSPLSPYLSRAKPHILAYLPARLLR